MDNPQEPLRVLIERLDGRSADVSERIQRIEKALFVGNGEPGVLSRVSTLEANHRMTRWIVGLMVTASTVVVSIISVVLRYH